MNSCTKVLYGTVGTVSLLVGIVFLFLPVLPPIPSLALAAHCFSKASARFYNKLISIPDLGKWLNVSSDTRLRQKPRATLIIMLFILTLFGTRYLFWL